ncbi:MAG TPA: glycosyltransferase [Candidatus Dojkabacteria bacterium]|nr:glycosyltransferase [Candidatus Dojkabacteria bacterium]
MKPGKKSNKYLQGHDVLLMSSSNYNLFTKNVLNAQILAEELADRGVNVVFVESLGLKTLPVIGKTDILKVFKRLFDFLISLFKGAKKPYKNIYVVSPIRLPFENISFIKKINELFLTSTIKNAAKKYLKPNPILWMFLPNGNFLIDKIPHALSIYHNVDDYSEIPFVDKKYIKREEQKILNKVDLTFVVSKNTGERFKQEYNYDKSIYINNVARFDVFNKALTYNPKNTTSLIPKELRPFSGRPIIGFMGNIASYKEDLDLIYRTAKLLPDYDFFFIGPIGAGELTTQISNLSELDNTTFVGPKDYKDLYKYYKYFDVSYIARKKNKANEGGFPLKYFEYLAAGLPVIVTSIKALEDFSRIKELGGIADTPDEFAKRIKYWVDLKYSDDSKKKAEYKKYLTMRIKIAKENSWDKRMVYLEKIVNKYLK